MNVKQLLHNKLFWILAFLITVIIILLINLGGSPPLTLLGTNPKNGSVVNPDLKEVRFSFSHDINGKTIPEIQVIPSTNFQSLIIGKDLVLQFSEGIEDQTNYNIIVENVRARSGGNLDVASLSFSVNDTSAAGKFKRELPYNADLFSLWHVRGNEFYVVVRSRDFNKVKAAAESLFVQAGLNPSDYTINYDTNTTASEGGEPTPIEQELIEEGDESEVN